MKSLLSRALLVFYAMAILASCEGPMGPEGQEGLDGTDGANGVGNITTHIVIIPDVNDVLQINQPGANLGDRYYDLSMPAITTSVVEKGAVLGYLQIGTGGNAVWRPLPYTVETNIGHLEYTYDYSVGSLSIIFEGGTSAVDKKDVILGPYKFVIIP